ncbi:hypothetical protein LCM20_18090 [Halobacillus litoralis]|uniref:LiaF transmembrane domain-containing protein n=1 Tax=Halobacillus litoralis TaxID=45668 RepID=UPI001CD62B43|nr:hypothetical protein [Halobacillus litoralis]MCA0972511.1 hypothetical protein [Halobacillus litoralis]
MRKWRVGTISMGLTLVLLGVVLLLSSFVEAELISLTMTWWPVILIVLGAEVILYLLTSKQEKPVVHYDFISILFIGILGTAGVALYSVTSLGLVEEVKASVNYETVERALPVVEEDVADLQKIVIEMDHLHATQIETNQSEQLQLFGRYTTNAYEDDALQGEDVVSMNRVDDTLYVQLLNAGERIRPVLSVPNDVEVDVRSEGSRLKLVLDEVEADWSIEGAGLVEVRVGDAVDASFEGVEASEVFGEGTHTISLSRVTELDLY